MEKEMELISRDEAIVETWRRPHYTDPLNVLTEVRDRIQNLPTASKHDEFEKALVDLFAPIMECDINHPKYEETVADIIKDVMRAYDELHPEERKDNG
jgi:hypothetical protein